MKNSKELKQSKKKVVKNDPKTNGINKKKLLKKKQKQKQIKVVINTSSSNSDLLKKAIEETSKLSKKIKQIREKRNQQKGILKKELEIAPQITQSEKIWFEVDKVYLPEKQTNQTEASEKTQTEYKLTKAIGIDCEMVGVGDNGKDSIIARVSIVNQFGECVYDKYVQPTEQVTDYRTHVSGIRPEDLKKHNAHPFKVIQKEVAEIIEGRILVGHAIHNDLQCLLLSHPKKKIRDTQKCKLFRKKHPSIGSLSSLKNLAKILLGLNIQEGEHNSVQDAQAVMRIYTTFRKEWEQFIKDGKLSKKVTEKETIMVQMGDANALDGIKVIKGNENHKRYVKNKLKRRSNKAKFIK